MKCHLGTFPRIGGGKKGHPFARPTSYEFALYEVALSSESALAKVAANPDNCWVTEAEILSGWCNDGTRVSPIMMRIVMRLSNERA